MNVTKDLSSQSGTVLGCAATAEAGKAESPTLLGCAATAEAGKAESRTLVGCAAAAEAGKPKSPRLALGMLLENSCKARISHHCLASLMTDTPNKSEIPVCVSKPMRRSEDVSTVSVTKLAAGSTTARRFMQTAEAETDGWRFLVEAGAPREGAELAASCSPSFLKATLPHQPVFEHCFQPPPEYLLPS